jgi:hypothetical protein
MPDPPVHAVRDRDVLQLDGLRALLGTLRTCRIEGGEEAHAYARTCMFIRRPEADCVPRSWRPGAAWVLRCRICAHGRSAAAPVRGTSSEGDMVHCRKGSRLLARESAIRGSRD